MKKITPIHLLTLLVAAITIIHACGPVSGWQPNIVNGGRIVALTTHPRDNNMVIAAAETGGLFRTNNGGKYWIHLDGFLQFAMCDVKYATADASVVVATALVDTRAINGGGIWRSTNNGDNWIKPATAEPPPSPRHMKRVSAYGISFEPGSQTVIVGTDCGVAISTNLGSTWKHVIPDPFSLVNADSSQDRIWSVVARGGGNMNIAGPDGIFYSNDGGNTWRRSATPPFGVTAGFHRFAVSPLNEKHVFLTTDNRTSLGYATYVSSDGGINWTSINVPEEGFVRPSFVKTGKSLSGNRNQFELYYGTGLNTYRQTCTNSNIGPVLSGAWNVFKTNHTDPSDIAFDVSNTNPIMLAGDGGIHLKEGDTWNLAGGGNNGLHALQITEVAGHQVALRAATDKEPDFHTDLYFGTQDNSVWASPDGGSSWSAAYGGEGFFVQPEGRKILMTDEARVVFVACTDCNNIFSGAYFAGAKSWNNPNNKLEGNPFYLLKPGQYVQTSQKSISPVIYTMQVTNSYGAAWTPRIDIPYERCFVPKMAQSPTGPVMYQPVVKSTSSGPIIGLLKIKNLTGSATPVVYNADGTGFGSLGQFVTMFVPYVVYGVNPLNPDHLIMADISTHQMKYSLNGGRCWYVDDALTKLVTDNGNFRFYDNGFLMQVHAIAFDPDSPGRIMVGTQQAGVICSEDGGITWEKIEDTEKITHISSFFFDFDHSVVVSTYGRGLWKIMLNEPKPYKKRRTDERCFYIQFDDKVNGEKIKFEDLSDISGCIGCKMMTVKDGEINDIITDPNGRITRIDISGSYLVGYDSAYRETKVSDIQQSVSAKKNIEGNEKIRGIVIQKEKIRGYIISPDNFPEYSKFLMPTSITEPYLNIFSSGNFGGLPSVEAGDSITLVGNNFDISGGPIAIYAGNDTLAKYIPVDKAGDFLIQVQIKTLRRGIHNVHAVQRRNNGSMIKTLAQFCIVAEEAPYEREK